MSQWLVLTLLLPTMDAEAANGRGSHVVNADKPKFAAV
jgi:hypothetical protein